MSITVEQAQTAMQHAECLHSAEAVQAAIKSLAADITAVLADKDPLFICVMNGGLVTAGHLLAHLPFPLQVDYLHATRYRGETAGAADVHWLCRPQNSLKGRHVLLVDDILDEGHTLREIVRWCQAQEPASVRVAVLIEKIHNRRNPEAQVDFCALQVPDRYVFGFGMDYKEYWRNADGIYAAGE
ncbi:hypoxanthine-guanine phosphoribosyltransferase [Thiofilum flexile]|uniref:hypoxanthine-guanine phosphoribosyltransferase n=1 Tax=Thiofilum flexile TaxID=125627 RepID=UPI00035FE848|nr:hypoxanthine-guanine phosphoribosyltransferase [Thiofilum flexile]